MEISFFWKGLLIGLAIAAPVGPIGVLCIRRTLTSGWRTGFATGLGAATADALYGAVAAFGMAAVSSVLVDHQSLIRLGGGLALLLLGFRTFRAPVRSDSEAVGRRGLGGAYASSLALTLTNPATILSFVAVFAGLGLVDAGESGRAAGLIVTGVFLGSATWWLLLSGVVSQLRRAVTPVRRVWINRISGLILAAFGVAALLTAV